MVSVDPALGMVTAEAKVSAYHASSTAESGTPFEEVGNAVRQVAEGITDALNYRHGLYGCY